MLRNQTRLLFINVCVCTKWMVVFELNDKAKKKIGAQIFIFFYFSSGSKLMCSIARDAGARGRWKRWEITLMIRHFFLLPSWLIARWIRLRNVFSLWKMTHDIHYINSAPKLTPGESFPLWSAVGSNSWTYYCYPLSCSWVWVDSISVWTHCYCSDLAYFSCLNIVLLRMMATMKSDSILEKKKN